MAMQCFLTVEGKNQGEIEGSCDIENLEGTVEVYAFDHLVEVPQRKLSSLPSGRHVHSNILISKVIDKSTPKLYQALCTGEVLPTATFAWYRFNELGELEQTYTVTLTDAVITKIKPWVPNRLEDIEQYSCMEDVSFSYQSINWTWEPDGIEYEDTWEALGEDDEEAAE